nr:hypothetical protein [Tanacetum cinerariifolium]
LNPKRRNRRRSKQPFILEESPIDTMADQRTMAEFLRAPTDGYAEAIVVPSIIAEQFELKHSLINMITSDQFFGLEKDNPHDHIRWFNNITSTIKYKDVPNSAIKLMLFPFSLAGAARQWLEKEPSHSIHTWEDLVSKFINEFFPPSRTTNLRNEISNFQQRFDESFHKVHNSQNKSVVSQVKSCDANSNSSLEIAKLTHAVNQQTSAVTIAMTAILKQIQATPPPAFVKAVEETCVTCGEQSYQAPTQQNQNVPLNELEKVKRMNKANMKAMQTQINMMKNELRNEMKNSIQASLSNQTNKIKNMMASLFQMNSASTSGSGSLPSNTVANPKGELKSITTQSGRVLDGPTVPTPLPFINPEEDERVEETLTDLDLSEYTFKLHINITLADALILMPKYQKMLKALLFNKEKLQELANTPLNENCLAVILKKLPEKLGDPRKFLIPCGFSELKCKALADLGASINLMPLFVWKELANRAICTLAGIARDVFVSVGKFTFPADFVIVDYESDPRVSLILGRPFLRTAHALINVHGEEMILCDGDERLTLNMRHDTSSYSKQPQKESINLINVFNNSSEDFLEDLFSNQPSGNPTFLSHPELISLEVKDDIFDLEGDNVLPEKLLDLDSTKDLHPPLHDNPLSGTTTYSSSPNPLLEELADELALITFPLKYDGDLQFDIEFDLKEIEFLLHKDIDSSLKDSIDQSNLANPADNFVDSMPEMFTDEHALDYVSPLIFDEYDDDFLEIESDAENVYDDPFDSKGEKIKESKLLIDELDLPCDFLPMMTSEQFFGLEKDNPHDHVRCSELAKLAHAVNQQTSAVTTVMTAMLKQFQSNPPPAQDKAVEEIYVTCKGAHPYYQCLTAGGNTFLEYRDNIQGYVSAAIGNFNEGNPGYRPQGVANQMRPPGFAQPNVQ